MNGERKPPLLGPGSSFRFVSFSGRGSLRWWVLRACLLTCLLGFRFFFFHGGYLPCWFWVCLEGVRVCIHACMRAC